MCAVCALRGFTPQVVAFLSIVFGRFVTNENKPELYHTTYSYSSSVCQPDQVKGILAHVHPQNPTRLTRGLLRDLKCSADFMERNYGHGLSDRLTLGGGTSCRTELGAPQWGSRVSIISRAPTPGVRQSRKVLRKQVQQVQEEQLHS